MEKHFFMKYIFLVVFFVFSFYSCKKQESVLVVDEIISYSERNIGDIAELIENVEFIPLEDSELALLRDASKIVVDQNRIYVHDRRINKLVIFNEIGDFLFSIDKKGAGPEEYIELKNFAVDDSLFYFIDNYTNKLRFYDKFSGLYKGKYDLPFVVDDVEIFDNGDFLFCVSPYGGEFNLNQTPHRIFITDNTLNIKERFLGYEKKHDDPIDKQFYFNKDNDYIYFNVAMQDYIYSFSKSGLLEYKTLSIDFGDKVIPDEYRNDFEASSPYRFLYETPYFIDEYILFDINAGEYLEVFIYDKKTKRWYMNNPTDRNNYILPVRYAQGKHIYSLLFEGFDSYHDLVKNGFNRASFEVEEHIKNEGWVLVKYTLK